MKIAVLAVLASILASPAAWAGGQPPSDKVILELLDVGNARGMMSQMRADSGTRLDTALKQMVRGLPMTPERQAVLDRMQTQINAVIDRALDWDAIQPLYMKLYRESFTQEEMNGMLKFYRTPAGQAMLKKLPLLMQNTMTEISAMMKPTIGLIARLQAQGIEEIKALPEQ
jgi:hypothetical protein